MTVSYEHRLLFGYEGPLTMELLPSLVHSLDKLLAEEGLRPPMRRKIVTSLIELAQNIIRYASNDDQHLPSISITRTEKGILITTRNLIYYSQELFLQAYLQNLLQMSREELERLHHSTLMGGSFSEKGGASLGLIQVILKADAFSYEITPVNDQHSWFTVKALFNVSSYE